MNHKILKFISEDKRFIINIPPACIEQLLSNIEGKDTETGGVVIGKYSEDLRTAFVEFISDEPPDSKSGFNWFIRGVKGLSQLFKRFKSQKSFYIGEWHFHPESSTNPSGTDKTQLSEIAFSNNYKCPEPIMIIIGGNIKKFKVSVFIMIKKINRFEQLTDITDSIE